MAILEAWEIAELRADIADALPDTCDAYRPPARATAPRTPQGDIDRSFPASWTKANTSPLKCRVDLPDYRGDERQQAGQAQATSYPRITFEADAPIAETTRIIILTSLNPLLVGKVIDVIESPVDSFGIYRAARGQIRE